VEAAREYASVIVESPLNVSLMRAQIVELAVRFPDALVPMLYEVQQIAQEHERIPQLGLVLAELRLRNDDPEGAWQALRPALEEGSLVQDLLRLSMAQLADSRLPDVDAARSLRSLRLGARIARALMESTQLPQSLRPRVYDTLVRTLLTMLENPAFAALPESEQLALLEEARGAVIAMNRQFPNNRLTAAAMLRLADAYVDALGRPEQAIGLYQILSMDPNAPREQIGLAQLGLARSYVASGDTAQGREILIRIATDVDFVEGQGRAQYELGLLDFMGGHFETAVDRFKAVAFASPKAAYSNDALDLALVLTEEQMAAAPDEQGLSLYGRALYHRATGRRDSLRAELQGLDRRAPSVVRERARVDLARLYREEGESGRALRLLERSAQEAPGSRYATTVLVLKGDVLSDLGREAEALAVYESVLVEHEGYVFADRLRDKIRALRGEAPQVEGELP
jgi:tetratricopeptide (TPR) repeat protein